MDFNPTRRKAKEKENDTPVHIPIIFNAEDGSTVCNLKRKRTVMESHSDEEFPLLSISPNRRPGISRIRQVSPQSKGADRLKSVEPGCSGIARTSSPPSPIKPRTPKRMKRNALDRHLFGKPVTRSIGGPPTLHTRTLVSPDASVKDFCVDSQKRFRIVKRQSYIQSRTDTQVNYAIEPEKESSDMTCYGEHSILCLKGPWAEMKNLPASTLVNLIGVDQDENKTYVADRLQGFVIVDPDQLISATSVIAQLYCERKAALSKLVPGGGDAVLAFRGVLAHELIATAMTRNLITKEELQKAIKDISKRPEMLERAYGLRLKNIDMENIRDEAVNWVEKFIRTRFADGGKKNAQQDFVFKEVLSIEETVWNPIYGLKGKIDSTVLIEKKGGKQLVVPLEFKTGSTKPQKRQVVRADHVGQVSLYTLMMSMRFGSIDEAMLYYISDDSLSLTPPRMLELQQLILARNKLVLSSKLSKEGFDKLPRPDGIDFDFKCVRCEVRVACSRFLKKTTEEESRSPTENMIVESCSFSDDEEKFFDDWLYVISCETLDIEKKYNTKLIWTTTPEEREAAGTCVANLKMIGDTSFIKEDANGRPGYLIRLKKVNIIKDSENQDWDQLNVKIDDYVIFSSNVEPCITPGVVVMVKNLEITLLVENQIHKEYATSDFVYCLDRVNSTSPIGSQFGYLLKLMDDDPDAKRLREYIIKKKQPLFSTMKLPPPRVKAMMKELNEEQIRVITKALCTDSFLFVKGIPGSGKTTTIVALIRALVALGKCVLVVSYTGMALENILLKYKEYGETFLKVGNVRSDDKFTDNLTRAVSKSVTAVDELTQFYNEAPVVGTTLLSLKHPLFQVRRFHYCIIDEASQALPTAVLGALLTSEKYVIFGDPNQLPPVTTSSALKTRDLPDNFFSLMSTPACTINLTKQYRMNKGITGLANKIMYNGEMVCGSRQQEKAYLNTGSENELRDYLMEKVPCIETRRTLCHAISKHHLKSVVFFDTTGLQMYDTRKEGSISNEGEKTIALAFAKILIDFDVTSVGVIAPYRAQVKLIRQAMKNTGLSKFNQVEVNTVDQYQGREMDVIICSMTKSYPQILIPRQYRTTTQEETTENEDSDQPKKQKELGILEDIRRLNVAVTRAKKKLILIGNKNCLLQFTPFQKLFDHLEEVQIFRLTTEQFYGLKTYARELEIPSPPGSEEPANDNDQDFIEELLSGT